MLPQPHITHPHPHPTPHNVCAREGFSFRLFANNVHGFQVCFMSLQSSTKQQQKLTLLNQFFIRPFALAVLKRAKKMMLTRALSIFVDVGRFWATFHPCTSVWCNECVAHTFNYSDHIVVATTASEMLFWTQNWTFTRKRDTHTHLYTFNVCNSSPCMHIHSDCIAYFDVSASICVSVYVMHLLHSFRFFRIRSENIALKWCCTLHIGQSFTWNAGTRIDWSSYFPELFIESLFDVCMYIWASINPICTQNKFRFWEKYKMKWFKCSTVSSIVLCFILSNFVTTRETFIILEFFDCFSTKIENSTD